MFACMYATDIFLSLNLNEFQSLFFGKWKIIYHWFHKEKKNKRPADSEMNHFLPSHLGMTERLLTITYYPDVLQLLFLNYFHHSANSFIHLICNLQSRENTTTDTIIPGKCTVRIRIRPKYRIRRSAVQKTKHKRNAHTQYF